jgi:transposase InsO family protein
LLSPDDEDFVNQTNGKVEYFNRTLLDARASLRPHTTNAERTAALADFLHTNNHHRPRTR